MILFILFSGVDGVNSDLHFYKITFGSITADWANKIACIGVSWTQLNSETLIDSQKLYTLVPFGNSRYLYFTSFKIDDGSVLGGRYKSNTVCNNVWGSSIGSGYIAATLMWTSYNLHLFNLETEIFIFRYFSGELFGSEFGSIGGR